ncbi:MAG: FHA domain-containing protein [Planctomycetes bacterium]|nr:FHA domain-containing protein [Planctomycetota bacterium]
MYLQILFGQKRSLEVSDDFMATFGRDEEADITLDSGEVSRQHGEFYWDQGVLVVRDLGSKNGVSVNNVKVEELALKVGDIVKVGKVIAFQVVDSPDPVADDLQQGNVAAPIQDAEIIADDVPVEELALRRSSETMVLPKVQEEPEKEERNLMPILTGLGIVVILLLGYSVIQPSEDVEDPSEVKEVYGRTEYRASLNEGVQAFREKRYADVGRLMDKPIELYDDNDTAHILESLSLEWIKKGEGYEKLNWRKAESLCRELLDVPLKTKSATQLAEDLLGWIKREEPNMAIIQRIRSDVEEELFDSAIVKLLDLPENSPLRIHYSTELGEIEVAFWDNHMASHDRAVRGQDWQAAINALEVMRINPKPGLDIEDMQAAYRLNIRDKSRVKSARSRLEEGRFEMVRQMLSDISVHSPYYEDAEKVLERAQESSERIELNRLYRTGAGEQAIEYAQKHFPDEKSFVTKVKGLITLLKLANGMIAQGTPEDVGVYCRQIMDKEPSSKNYYHKRAQELLDEWASPQSVAESFVRRGNAALLDDDLAEAVKFFSKAKQLDETIGADELKSLDKKGWSFYNKALVAAGKNEMMTARQYLKSARDYAAKDSVLYQRIVNFAEKHQFK